MTDRREFLQYAMVTAVPLTTGVTLAGGETVAASKVSADRAVPLVVRHVVIDSRHLESRAFGASLAGSGATVHALADGDATDLWLQTLGPAWRTSPVPVAGLTRLPALFILEQFAWSHGLRVVFQAEHVVSSKAPAVHHIQRAPVESLTVNQLQRFDASWPVGVADLVAGYAPVLNAAPRPGPTAAGLLPALPPGGELLTSWIIAPA